MASGGVPGVRYAEKLSGEFYLHWERFWLGVGYDKTIFPIIFFLSPQVKCMLGASPLFINKFLLAFTLLFVLLLYYIVYILLTGAGMLL